jgi:hypothetical protein
VMLDSHRGRGPLNLRSSLHTKMIRYSTMQESPRKPPSRTGRRFFAAPHRRVSSQVTATRVAVPALPAGDERQARRWRMTRAHPPRRFHVSRQYLSRPYQTGESSMNRNHCDEAGVRIPFADVSGGFYRELLGLGAIALSYCSAYLGQRLIPTSFAKAASLSFVLTICVAAGLFSAVPAHAVLSCMAFSSAAFTRLLQRVPVPLLWFAGTAGPITIVGRLIVGPRPRHGSWPLQFFLITRPTVSNCSGLERC